MVNYGEYSGQCFTILRQLPSILSNDVFVVNESYSGNCSTCIASNPGPTPTPTVTTSVTNSPTTTQTPSVTPTKSITPTQTPTPTNGLRTVVVKSCCTTKLGGNTVSQQLVNTSNNIS